MTIQLIHLILTIHVATVIRQHLIVVAKVNQRIQQVAVASRPDGLNRPVPICVSAWCSSSSCS
jgi:hypothetical protein